MNNTGALGKEDTCLGRYLNVSVGLSERCACVAVCDCVCVCVDTHLASYKKLLRKSVSRRHSYSLRNGLRNRPGVVDPPVRAIGTV